MFAGIVFADLTGLDLAPPAHGTGPYGVTAFVHTLTLSESGLDARVIPSP